MSKALHNALQFSTEFILELYTKGGLEVFDTYIQGIDLHLEQERHTNAIILNTWILKWMDQRITIPMGHPLQGYVS